MFMNLIQTLEREHSITITNEIIHWIGNNQQRFDALMQIIYTAEYRIVQRASWPLGYIAANHPSLINKHYDKMLSLLDQPNQPTAVRRNLLRILDQIPEIKEAFHGTIMDACFRYIENPNEPIAVQAFALGILHKLSTQYPEIVPEILSIIEIRLPEASPALKSKAKKFYKIARF